MSRQFSEGFGGGLVIEASQAGAIVIGDEAIEIGITFGVVEKATVVGGTIERDAAEVLATMASTDASIARPRQAYAFAGSLM